MARRLPALLLLAYAAVAACQEYCPEGGQCDMDTEESVPNNLNLLQVGLNLKREKEDDEADVDSVDEYGSDVDEGNAADCKVMSITLGADSENGEFCQEGCFDPDTLFAKEGHKHVDTIQDKDCGSRGFEEYHHDLHAGFEGKKGVASTIADDSKECNMHYIAEGDFCEIFCLGHQVTNQDGVKMEDGTRMEKHGAIPGTCGSQYGFDLGWHKLKVYGPEGQV